MLIWLRLILIALNISLLLLAIQVIWEWIRHDEQTCQRSRQEFRDKFPPISDKEFLARCRPGTNPIIALKVREIVADQLGVDYARVYPESRLVEDLGMD